VNLTKKRCELKKFRFFFLAMWKKSLKSSHDEMRQKCTHTEPCNNSSLFDGHSFQRKFVVIAMQLFLTKVITYMSQRRLVEKQNACGGGGGGDGVTRKFWKLLSSIHRSIHMPTFSSQALSLNGFLHCSG